MPRKPPAKVRPRRMGYDDVKEKIHTEVACGLRKSAKWDWIKCSDVGLDSAADLVTSCVMNVVAESFEWEEEA